MGSREYYMRMSGPSPRFHNDDIPPPPPPPRRDYDHPPPPPPPRREFYEDYDCPPPPPPPRNGSPHGGGYYNGPPRGRGRERGRGADRGRGMVRGGMRGRGQGGDRWRGHGGINNSVPRVTRLDQPTPANAKASSSTPIKPPTPTKDLNVTSKPAWLSRPASQSSTNNDSNTASKPTWLNQPAHPSGSPANATTGSKPAWLNQQPTTQTSATPPATSSSPANATTGSKPAWLNQQPTMQTSATPPATSSSPANATTGSKPAWLNQQSTTQTPSAGIPAWLKTSSKNIFSNTAVASTSSLSSSANSTAATTNNTSTKPAWINQDTAKPAWLNNTMQQTGNQCFTSKAVKTEAEYAIPAKHLVPQPATAAPTKAAKTAELVIVARPGASHFISFKNSLQEFSQKKGFHVPVYTSKRAKHGLVVTVQAADQNYQSNGLFKERKEAEQNAAWVALKGLGLIPADTPFNSKSPVKRPASSTPNTVAKKLKRTVAPATTGSKPTWLNQQPTTQTSATPPATSGLNRSYKSQLNEFCQKFHLAIPTYKTNRDRNGFVSHMIYNKKVYQSTSPQLTKKLAEQNVAQFVLSKVNQALPPVNTGGMRALHNVVHVMAQKQPDGTAQVISTSTAITAESVRDLIIPEGGVMVSYKNKLQEYCQKNKLLMPVYDSCRVGKHFVCNVMVGIVTYTATGCETKKGSEQSAARVALQTLGHLLG